MAQIIGKIVRSKYPPENTKVLWLDTKDDLLKAFTSSGWTKVYANTEINALRNAGYLFAGIATTDTNPEIPDAKVFYIANGKGTYTNFGSLEVTEDDVVVLYWDTAWHKVATGIATQAKLSELESEVDGQIVSLSEEKADILIISNNLVNNKDITYSDSIIDEWGVGHILEVKDSTSTSVLKVPVVGGNIYTFGGKSDVRTYAFTDANMIIVQKNKWVDRTQIQTDTAPIGAVYLWLSVYNTAIDKVQVNKGDTLLPYDEFNMSVGAQGKDVIAPLREEVFKVTESLQDISNLVKNIDSEVVASDDSIIITDDNDNEIVKISNNGADFARLTQQGKSVVTEANIPLDNIINESGIIEDKIVIADEESNAVASFTKDGVDCKNLKSNGQYVQSLEDAISNDDELRRDLAPLCDFRIAADGEKKTLRLKNTNGGKYLIALHRKENNGSYQEENDVFLPSARKDFSDVRISANGDTLSQRVLYCGNFDVLKTQSTSMLKGRIHTYNGVFYCGGINGGVYSSTDGNTWNKIAVLSNDELGYSARVCLISSKGTMFIGYKGVLYKSSYPYTSKKEVLNENAIHPSSVILAASVAEDDKGNIFVGHYQEERDIILQKSTDDGETWNICYRDNSGKYQHIHAVYYDNFSKILYVGCDGGGGVLYSTDNGNTFADLRDKVTNLPQSTDNGVIYAEKGFRLLGGETSIVGGFSLIKTTNDKEFKGVLACGKGCYVIHKLGKYLIAPMLSSNNFNTSQILYSEDNGDSWKLLYATSCHDDKGASDGFRDMSVVGDKLFIISQGASFHNVVIEQTDSSYYAEVMVDVPVGVDELEIETGYAMRKAARLSNDMSDDNAIFYAPLNSERGVYAINGTYSDNLMKWDIAKGGRTIADIYPHIISADDMQSVIIKEKAFYTGMLNLPSQFHIGFWMKSQQDSTQFSIIKSSDLHVEIRNNYQLYVNNAYYYSFNFPMVENCYIRVDINVAREQYVDMIINGRVMARKSVVPPSYTLNNQYELLKGDGDFAMQHFCITNGIINAEEAQALYDSGLTDNK